MAKARSDIHERRHEHLLDDRYETMPPPPWRAPTVDQESSQLPLYYNRGNIKTQASDVAANKGLYVLGIPLHRLSRLSQFFVCVGGVMVFYLLYGYTQVSLFQTIN